MAPSQYSLLPPSAVYATRSFAPASAMEKGSGNALVKTTHFFVCFLVYYVCWVHSLSKRSRNCDGFTGECCEWSRSSVLGSRYSGHAIRGALSMHERLLQQYELRLMRTNNLLLENSSFF